MRPRFRQCVQVRHSMLPQEAQADTVISSVLPQRLHRYTAEAVRQRDIALLAQRLPSSSTGIMPARTSSHPWRHPS